MYTDGSCLGNPGPGGWAAYHVDSGELVTGPAKHTTNNQMELMAVIRGLERFEDITEVYSDSTYVVKGVNEWMANWKRKGWKKVANVELWKRLDGILRNRKHVSFYHVFGHSGNPYNELVDNAAVEQATAMRRKLRGS